MLGAQYTVKVHTDSTNRIVFDALTVNSFSHEASFVTPVTVVKVNDYPALHLDGYEVITSYPAGQIPASSTTIYTFVSVALAAIQAVVPGGVGGGTPLVDPSI